MRNYIPLFQLVLAISLLIIYVRKFGLLSSISAYYYAWRSKEESRVFDVLIIGILGLPTLLYAVHGFRDVTLAFYSLAGFFVSSVSFAPLFKQKGLIEKIHYGAALLGIIFGLLAITSNAGIVTVLWGILPAIPIGLFTKKRIFWLEVYFIVYIFGKTIFLNP